MDFTDAARDGNVYGYQNEFNRFWHTLLLNNPRLLLKLNNPRLLLNNPRLLLKLNSKKKKKNASK